jgi:hypothetical protein
METVLDVAFSGKWRSFEVSDVEASVLFTTDLLWRSAGQEISCLLWNPTVHYCVHNNPPLVSILSQMNLVHTFMLNYFKNHFNINLPYMPMSLYFQ